MSLPFGLVLKECHRNTFLQNPLLHYVMFRHFRFQLHSQHSAHNITSQLSNIKIVYTTMAKYKNNLMI